MPYSESVCREVALALGLQLGGNSYPFVATRDDGYQMGCYTYKAGVGYDHYVGIAFYGSYGDDNEMSKPFDENPHFYRPKGYDCRIEGNLYYFFSSMSRKHISF